MIELKPRIVLWGRVSKSLYATFFKGKWALTVSQTEFMALFKVAPKIFDDLAILVDKSRLNSHDPTLRGAIFQLSERYLIILEDTSIECFLHELQHYDLYRLVGVEGANFMLDNVPHDRQIGALWEAIRKIH